MSHLPQTVLPRSQRSYFQAYVSVQSRLSPLPFLIPFCWGLLCCAPQADEAEAPAVSSRQAEALPWEGADQPIAWKVWDPETLDLARRLDRPVLLYAAAPGGEGMFARDRPILRSLVEERFVGVRFDPLKRPDLARFFAAEGWPAVAFLLPDGRLFARAVDVPPANMEPLLLRLLSHYEDRRAVVEAKVAAAEQRRSGRRALTPDEVLAAARADFDTVHGGFGTGPRFIEIPLLLFLLERAGAGDAMAGNLARRHLDAVLASPLWDGATGGVAAYSRTPDWRTPAAERDGADQAGLLSALLEAARTETRYEVPARRQLDYILDQLFDGEQGYFRGRQVRAADAWWTDPAFYADRNALLIGAVHAAAERFGDARAATAAGRALQYLSDCCLGADGAVYHYAAGGRGSLPGILVDQALVGLALLDLQEGRPANRAQAERIADYMEKNLYNSEAAGFRPFLPLGAGPLPSHYWGPDASMPNYRDGQLPAGNALAVQLLIRLRRLDRAGAVLAGKRAGAGGDRFYAAYGQARQRYEQARRAAL